MAKKTIGSTCLFTNGPEDTPKVTVVQGTKGASVLEIEQNGQRVLVSAETLGSIVKWLLEV